MNNLDDVYDALVELKGISSTNLKKGRLKAMISDVSWVYETIHYSLDPYKQFKTNKVEFVDGNYNHNPGSIFVFLDQMAKKRGVSHADIRLLSGYASLSKKTVEVVKRIVNKDLKCGVQAKTANDCGMSIPIYEVMKPFGDNPFPGKKWPEFVKLCGGFDKIVWSIKADGFRTSYITVQDTGEVEYLSTAGKPYLGMYIFDDDMRQLAEFLNKKYTIRYPMKFDGEFVSKDGDFQKAQKLPRNAESTDPEIYRLLLWAVLSSDESGWPIAYMDCYDCLGCLITTTGEIYDLTEKVEANPSVKVFRLQHNFTGFRDTQEVIDKTREVIAGGNEGLIFKTPYHEHEFKRSKHWFRTKALYLKGVGVEEDLPVIGFEYGRKGTRLEKMLGKFVCDFNGIEVKVSGKLSDKMRIDYMENLPSHITVYADSITDDGSLRLPIFQRARWDK